MKSYHEEEKKITFLQSRISSWENYQLFRVDFFSSFQSTSCLTQFFCDLDKSPDVLLFVCNIFIQLFVLQKTLTVMHEQFYCTKFYDMELLIFTFILPLLLNFFFLKKERKLEERREKCLRFCAWFLILLMTSEPNIVLRREASAFVYTSNRFFIFSGRKRNHLIMMWSCFYSLEMLQISS